VTEYLSVTPLHNATGTPAMSVPLLGRQTEDVGRIVNPLTLHGQAIGGLVQGWAAPSSSTSFMTQTGSCWPATSPTT